MRSLMLAGGGIKAGYQAGCLQVLLDEVGPATLPFHHIDGASAGCLNAAMICSGKSGTDIADAWRRMNPFDLATFNVPELRKGPFAKSIATLDGLRKIFKSWGLDFARIRAYDAAPVTFNYFNFSTKSVVTLPNSELDEEYLCACVSLLFWFPPIERDGHTLVDAVFATDSNLSQALQRQADEIWAIWSVAKLPEIRNGIVAQYFHMLEQTADTKFFAEWDRIAKETKIVQHLVRQEVPIHYLFNFSRDRLAATVDLGVSDMRLYCRERGLLPQIFALGAPTRPVSVPATSVRFTEKLCGFYFVPNGDGFATQPLEFHVTLATGDLDTFVRRPEHEAQLTWGTVTSPEFGGTRAVTTGSARILTDERAPATGGDPGVIVPGNKRMLYSARFRSDAGKPFLLEGKKYAVDGPGKNAWRDTTTLYVRLLELDDAGEAVVRLHGAGIVTLSPLGFLAQVASFRTAGAPGFFSKAVALRRFFQFFIRQCWDVYARGVLDYAPF